MRGLPSIMVSAGATVIGRITQLSLSELPDQHTDLDPKVYAASWMQSIRKTPLTRACVPCNPHEGDGLPDTPKTTRIKQERKAGKR